MPSIETLAQTFKALSDPTRLNIVHLLLDKDSLCVCEIMENLALKQSTASRHLAYLKHSGLVTSWREGVWMHYALKKDALTILNREALLSSLGDPKEIHASAACC